MHIDNEVTARTAKAGVAFGRLRTNVWGRNGIRLDTKLKVYKAVVLPNLLYACETWTVYQRHAKKLNHFHLSCLRKILKIRWQDKIPGTEVLKKAKMQSVHTPTESLEQAAQDRTKWRCPINKGASQFEAKRICEAERKRKERKARAKGPLSDSAQSEFTCSICNRQFRAKIGLYSNQRTYKHT